MVVPRPDFDCVGLDRTPRHAAVIAEGLARRGSPAEMTKARGQNRAASGVFGMPIKFSGQGDGILETPLLETGHREEQHGSIMLRTDGV